jgi:hypothetical protein
MTLRPSVCAKCEDKNRPVSEVNGFSFHYEVVKDMCVELFLHDKFSLLSG